MSRTIRTPSQRIRRRPTRTQSRHLLSGISLAILAFISIICLCPISANAQATSDSTYGTVIGVGTSEVFLDYLRLY